MMKGKLNLKYVITAAVVFVIIILAVLKSKGVIAADDMSMEVSVGEVQKTSIVQRVNASGKIQPKTEVKIAPEVSGEIIELTVKEGDEVRQGSLLVQIKPDIYLSSVNRANAAVKQSVASLEQSAARLKEAQNEYQRSKSLFESGTISRSDWEATETSYKVAVLNHEAAESQVESAKASLTEAEDNLTRTRIYAPLTGTISRLNVEKGERVVGTATMAGTEVLRVADLDVMEVDVTVSETDIVKLAVGNPVVVEVDAYWGRKFAGVVEEIASSSSDASASVDQVTNFAVKILLLEDSYKGLVEEKKMRHTPFKPGMTASVEIETSRKDNVLSVPVKCVTTRSVKDSTGVSDIRQVVYVFQKGKAVERVVETGIQDDENIEILSGLSENEQVITGPYTAISKTLSDGVQVKSSKEGK